MTRVLIFRGRIAHLTKGDTGLNNDNPSDDKDHSSSPKPGVDDLTAENVLCLVLALLTTGILQHESVAVQILTTCKLTATLHMQLQ